MKKVLLLVIGFTFCYDSSAQLYFGLKMGAEQVDVNHQDIFFEFVDESPSRDRIIESFTLSQQYFPVTIIPNLLYKAGDFDVEFSVKLGLESEFRTMGGYLGVSKNFGDIKKGAFGVGGQLGLGRSRVSLGDIFQNDLFIQINGNKYYEKSLAVSYYEQQLVIKPFVQYQKLVADKYPLVVSAGYQLPLLSFNGKVIFRGEDPNQEDGMFEEVVSLNRRNIAFFADGAERKKKVLNQQGVFFNIGIALPLN